MVAVRSAVVTVVTVVRSSDTAADGRQVVRTSTRLPFTQLPAGVRFNAPVRTNVTLQRVVLSGGGVASWLRSLLRTCSVLPLVVVPNAVARPQVPRGALDLTKLVVVACAEGPSSTDRFTEALDGLVVSVLITLGDQEPSQVPGGALLRPTTTLAVRLTRRSTVHAANKRENRERKEADPSHVDDCCLFSQS